MSCEQNKKNHACRMLRALWLVWWYHVSCCNDPCYRVWLLHVHAISATSFPGSVGLKKQNTGQTPTFITNLQKTNNSQAGSCASCEEYKSLLNLSTTAIKIRHSNGGHTKPALGSLKTIKTNGKGEDYITCWCVAFNELRNAQIRCLLLYI